MEYYYFDDNIRLVKIHVIFYYLWVSKILVRILIIWSLNY